jgi:DnaJ-class molecular chaperone
MGWTYYVVARRTCGECGGVCGWNLSDGFHKCEVCNGTGIEEKEVTLEDALKESMVIREINEDLFSIINAC